MYARAARFLNNTYGSHSITMPPTQADFDFGLQMYMHQMLPEQIEEQVETIEEHEADIEMCDRMIAGLRRDVKKALETRGDIGKMIEECGKRLRELETERKEYVEVI